MAVSPVDVRIYGRMAVIRWWLGSRVSLDVVKGGAGARTAAPGAPQENAWREPSVPLRRPTCDQG
jgi:hypothetical protein